MFSLFLRIKRRIKRLLKVHSDTRAKYAPSLRDRVIKTLILLTAAVLIAFAYPGEDLYNPVDLPRKGEIAASDIIAPFEIVVLKTDRELEDQRDKEKYAVPFVLVDDSAIARGVYSALHSFASLVDSLRNVRAQQSGIPIEPLQAILQSRFPFISTAALDKALHNNDDLTKIVERLENIYRYNIYEVGVLQDLAAIPEAQGKNVLVRRGDIEMVYQRDRVLDIAHANGRLITALNRLAVTDSIDVEQYYLIGRNFIQPNLWVAVDEYNGRVREALGQVSPIREVIEAGDIIVREGRRIGDREEAALIAMGKILRSQKTARNWVLAYVPAFARLLLVLAVLGSLYLMLYYFRRDIFRSNPKLFAIILVFLLQIFSIPLVRLLGLDESVYWFPVAMLPIMITILFDAEVGMLSTVVLALLLGVLHRFDFVIGLMTMVVGTVACFTSRRVRRRAHFYRIMFSVIIVQLGFVLLIEGLKLNPGEDMVTLLAYGLFMGVISPLVTIGLLPIFESVFGITTDITLLELSDLNHPLLKRLALEAPGTYHHSISVGNLCEAAAKSINANSLLARVGCYYHDIGKIEIPEYFVENQLGVKSRHEALSPSMSALIIAAHVKRGRALGEEADIPDDVLNFIEEHHGTMVMTYFYNKALEQGADPVVIDKFRYPGPKPQTRETGIAMLADAVEAASRTLDDPKPARIERLIQKIINERFQSGELDECPLTLRDLAKIREAFEKILMGAFHHRVKYPRAAGALD